MQRRRGLQFGGSAWQALPMNVCTPQLLIAFLNSLNFQMVLMSLLALLHFLHVFMWPACLVPRGCVLGVVGRLTIFQQGGKTESSVHAIKTNAITSQFKTRKEHPHLLNYATIGCKQRLFYYCSFLLGLVVYALTVDNC